MITQSSSYPITGHLREPLLIFESIIVFFFLEIAIFLTLRSKREGKKLIHERAFSGICFGYSIMWIFYLFGEYAIESHLLQKYIINLGFLAQIFGALVLIYENEKHQKILIRRYFFSISVLILGIITVIVLIFAIEIIDYVAVFFWPFLIIFIIFYLNKLRLLDKALKTKSLKKQAFYFITGLLLLSVGYSLTRDLTREMLNLDLHVRLIGDFLQLISLIFIIAFILLTPSFSEFDWQDKIESVYLMHRSGLVIFSKLLQKFSQRKTELDKNIISGNITTLKIMIENLSKKKGISVLERGEEIILIQPSSSGQVYGVIIAEENLISLRIMLKNFIDKFEDLYGETLKVWDGNLTIFAPVEDIFKESFPSVSGVD